MKDDREETEEIDDEQSLGVNIATSVSQTGKVSVTVSVTVYMYPSCGTRQHILTNN